jgi:hypothetical protein
VNVEPGGGSRPTWMRLELLARDVSAALSQGSKLEPDEVVVLGLAEGLVHDDDGAPFAFDADGANARWQGSGGDDGVGHRGLPKGCSCSPNLPTYALAEGRNPYRADLALHDRKPGRTRCPAKI